MFLNADGRLTETGQISRRHYQFLRGPPTFQMLPPLVNYTSRDDSCTKRQRNDYKCYLTQPVSVVLYSGLRTDADKLRLEDLTDTDVKLCFDWLSK